MVVHWDHEDHEPRVPQLKKISQQLNVSIDDIVFGSAGRPKPEHPQPEDTMIMHALDTARASAAARAAFGEHSQSAAGKFQRFTFDYVQRFAQAFDTEFGRGKSQREAAQVAFAEAVNKRAAVSAVLATPPASTASNAAAPRPRSRRRTSGTTRRQSDSSD